MKKGETRLIKAKRCKECNKTLRDWNVSGLCSYHYSKWKLDKKRMNNKKKELPYSIRRIKSKCQT